MWHCEEESSFRRKPGIWFFHCKRSSYRQHRRAVASTRKQERHSDHSAFLADGTDSDIDPADPKQLLLPGLPPVVLFCYGLAGSKDLTTYSDGLVPVSVRQ